MLVAPLHNSPDSAVCHQTPLLDGAGRSFPEFLIVGAGKSGTTSLASVLRQHPDVFMPDAKELLYFGLGAPNGLDLRGFFEWPTQLQATLPLVPHSISRSRGAYLQQFSAASPGQMRGEATPSYLYDPHAAERIKAATPGVKIIAILRNPADRAFSHYTRRVELGSDWAPSFDAVVDSEDLTARPFTEGQRHFVRMGFYWQQLQRYLALFPKEQIHVLLFEDYVNGFETCIRDVQKYLGLSYTAGALQKRSENASASPRWEGLHRAIAHPSPWRKRLLDVQPAILRRQIHNLGGWLRRKNMAMGSKPGMPTATREKLMKIYAEDIAQLSQFLGRDLSRVWRELKGRERSQ